MHYITHTEDLEDKDCIYILSSFSQENNFCFQFCWFHFLECDIMIFSGETVFRRCRKHRFRGYSETTLTPVKINFTHTSIPSCITSMPVYLSLCDSLHKMTLRAVINTVRETMIITRQKKFLEKFSNKPAVGAAHVQQAEKGS